MTDVCLSVDRVSEEKGRHFYIIYSAHMLLRYLGYFSVLHCVPLYNLKATVDLSMNPFSVGLGECLKQDLENSLSHKSVLLHKTLFVLDVPAILVQKDT